MTITYHGGTCVKIAAKGTTGEATVLIDPYPMKGASLPRDPAITVYSRGDQSVVGSRKSESFTITHPGEYEVRGIMVYGIPLVNPSPPERDIVQPMILQIEAEGMTLVHLGLLDHVLTEAEMEPLGKVDVVFLPVGGHGALTPEQAEDLMTELEPRIVVPIACKSEATPEYEPIEKFLKAAGLPPEKTDKLKIAKKDLPVEETRLVVLENA